MGDMSSLSINDHWGGDLPPGPPPPLLGCSITIQFCITFPQVLPWFRCAGRLIVLELHVLRLNLFVIQYHDEDSYINISPGNICCVLKNII